MSLRNLKGPEIGKDDISEHTYSNVAGGLRTRSVPTNVQKKIRKKPMPAPKASVLSNTAIGLPSSNAANQAHPHKPNLSHTVSSGNSQTVVEDDSEEPLYDDVSVTSHNPRPTKTAQPSVAEPHKLINKDAREVVRKPLLQFSASSGHTSKKSGVDSEGKTTHGEAIPVPVRQHSSPSTVNQKSRNADEHHLVNHLHTSHQRNKSNITADEGDIQKSLTRDKCMSSVKVSGKTVTTNKDNVVKEASTQKNAVYEEASAVRLECLGYEETSEENLYDDPLPVRTRHEAAAVLIAHPRKSNKHKANEEEPLYDEAAEVLTIHQRKLENRYEVSPEEPLYDEAATVQITHSRKLENRHQANEEPLYDEAAEVLTIHHRKLENRYEASPEEPLYDEAATVLITHPRKLENRHQANEVPLYDEAAEILTIRQRKLENSHEASQEEPLYDEADTVVTIRPRKLVNRHEASEEEPLYDEAASVMINNPKNLGNHLKNSQRRAYISKEKEPLYDEAEPVVTTKLPLEENPGKSSRRGHRENPYRNAVSVRMSFLDDSSDEEEPNYYNLLLVKVSLECSNRLFYENLGSELTMEKLERKAHRLSKLWGDASSSKASSSSKLQDYHPKLKPVKSDSDAKVISTDFEDYSAEDLENDVSETFLPHICYGDKLSMRKWIVRHILDSEKDYVAILNLLYEHMNTFKNLAHTEKCIISSKDNAVIFFKIPELHCCHYQFISGLGKVLQNWSTSQEVGKAFRDFAEQEYSTACEYLKNYKLAIKTVLRCRSESPVFATLSTAIPLKSGNSESLEELLHKPIVRFQQITLSIKDLIKSTTLDHPDYDVLQKILKSALICLNECTGADHKNANHHRYLVRHGLVVEKSDKLRKLRHIFLFSDVLICAKQKLYHRKRNFYEKKWFLPLQDIQLEEKFSAQAERQAAIMRQQTIDSLEKDLVRLRAEIRIETTKFKQPSDGQSRKIETLQKKVFQQEAALLEASPYLELKLHDVKLNKLYTFLLSSDYERTSWKQSIKDISSKVDISTPKITTSEVTSLLQSQRIPTMIGRILKRTDISLEKECLSGSLRVVIHKLHGLTEEADTFCVIEIDSFGHFFMRAKTNQCKSKEPSWEEDFDIDLEGAQTFHLLCYRIGDETDELLGKCALELNSAWLSGDFTEQPVPLTDKLVITVSLKHTPQGQLIQRSVAANKGMFGERLENIAEREGRLVPLLVTSCIEEIEARGLNELGIYRVSGLSMEVERLKTAFNKNGSSAASLVKNADINVLTSFLKFFFRELPESLFTDKAYPQLVKGVALIDPEAKEKFLLNTLRILPKCNYATITFMLDHLVRVSQNKDRNKMTLENLATIFGPTLLHPAINDRKPMTIEERLYRVTNDIAAQATILLYFLQLRANNNSFPLS